MYNDKSKNIDISAQVSPFKVAVTCLCRREVTFSTDMSQMVTEIYMFEPQKCKFLSSKGGKKRMPVFSREERELCRTKP